MSKETYVRWPFGPQDTQSLSGADLLEAVSVTNTRTVIELGALTENVTLDLTILEDLSDGDLTVRVSQVATGYNVTLGVGFDASAPDLAGVASDVDQLEFYYDATNAVFVQKTAEWQKLVDAA